MLHRPNVKAEGFNEMRVRRLLSPDRSNGRGLQIARLWFAFIGILLAGSFASASAEDLGITFKLEAHGVMAVSYRVPPGIDEMPLSASQAQLRRSQWRITGDSANLDDAGIRLAPHAHLVEFTINAKAVAAAPDRVYPLLVPFSDGGVVINTRAFVPSGPCNHVLLRFEPRTHEYVVLRGRVYRAPISVRVPCSTIYKGSYAYIGRERVVQSKAFVMVVDPSAPQWITRGTREALRTALTTYRKRLHLNLHLRPTIYLTYDQGSRKGRAWYHGDTLGFNSVRLSYVGEAWRDGSSASSNLLDTQIFIAHEAFHFWNGGIKRPIADPYGAWLVEGGAQLAALFTAKGAGWLSATDFMHRLNGSLQRCILETEGRTWAGFVNTQTDAQSFAGQSYYDCGVLFNYMIASLYDQRNPEDGFFTAWSSQLRSSQQTYSKDDFLHVTTAHNSANVSAIQDLTNALTGTGGSLAHYVELFFKAVKIPVGSVKGTNRLDVPSSRVLGEFLTPLLRGACTSSGRYGFWTKPEYVEVDVPEQCKAFQRSKRIAAIKGINLIDSPLAAWNEAYVECRDQATVVFTSLNGITLSVPCEKSMLPPPPRLLQIATNSLGFYNDSRTVEK